MATNKSYAERIKMQKEIMEKAELKIKELEEAAKREEDEKKRKRIKDGYKTGSANKLHIERIDKSALQSEYVSGVTVIFCAKKNTNETVIVGWYDDAQVFAVRKKVKDINGDPWEYNIVTDAENAHLIDENNRTFQVPRTKSKDEPGFGSSNIWYADDDKSRVIKASALEYIDSIRNKNIVSFDEI